MLEPVSVISAINTTCQQFFLAPTSAFILSPSSTNTYRLQGNASSSKAINNRKNNREEVTVIRWFEDYWLYVEITFVDQQTFISISVFQGESSDHVKHQLFRAEWDDYNNEETDHPQPHWHITANQAIEKAFDEFASDSDAGGFGQLLAEERNKICDLNKMHFAMNANWINDDGDVHPLNDETKIRKWFQGLLAHLRWQLEYIR